MEVGPEIHEKLLVEWTKLQICQSQTKSDIDWKCLSLHMKMNGFLRKCKDTKLKTKNQIENFCIQRKKRNQYQNITCQTTQL